MPAAKPEPVMGNVTVPMALEFGELSNVNDSVDIYYYYIYIFNILYNRNTYSVILNIRIRIKIKLFYVDNYCIIIPRIKGM